MRTSVVGVTEPTIIIIRVKPLRLCPCLAKSTECTPLGNPHSSRLVPSLGSAVEVSDTRMGGDVSWDPPE